MKNKFLASSIQVQTDLNEWPGTGVSKFRENNIFELEHKVVNCVIENKMLCGSISAICSIQWNLCALVVF